MGKYPRGSPCVYCKVTWTSIIIIDVLRFISRD